VSDVTTVRGWVGFVAWAAAGALVSLAVVSAASIGLFLLPVALAAVVAGTARVRLWPEALGAVAGLASTALVVGLLNVGSRPCPRNGSLVLPPGQREVSCGGLDAKPFLIFGVATGLIALASYAALRKAG
jgi:hypothetical protein